MSDKKLNTYPNEFRPLSVEDVIKEQQRLKDADPKELNDIFEKYSQALNSILVMAKSQTTDDLEIVELERIKRLINFTPKDEKFIRSKGKVWAVRDHILNKDAKYFLEKDYSTIIKKDHNQAMLETLVELIKEKFENMNDKEQNFYWQKAALLLNCVVRYKRLIGDFDE